MLYEVITRKDQARQVVAEGILLPIKEMLLRCDAQGIGADWCARMRGWAQPQHVRRQADRMIEPVMSDVTAADPNRHGRVAIV